MDTLYTKRFISRKRCKQKTITPNIVDGRTRIETRQEVEHERDTNKRTDKSKEYKCERNK
jgi:hypothetical protein